MSAKQRGSSLDPNRAERLQALGSYQNNNVADAAPLQTFKWEISNVFDSQSYRSDTFELCGEPFSIGFWPKGGMVQLPMVVAGNEWAALSLRYEGSQEAVSCHVSLRMLNRNGGPEGAQGAEVNAVLGRAPVREPGIVMVEKSVGYERFVRFSDLAFHPTEGGGADPGLTGEGGTLTIEVGVAAVPTSLDILRTVAANSNLLRDSSATAMSTLQEEFEVLLDSALEAPTDKASAARARTATAALSRLLPPVRPVALLGCRLSAADPSTQSQVRSQHQEQSRAKQRRQQLLHGLATKPKLGSGHAPCTYSTWRPTKVPFAGGLSEGSDGSDGSAALAASASSTHPTAAKQPLVPGLTTSPDALHATALAQGIVIARGGATTQNPPRHRIHTSNHDNNRGGSNNRALLVAPPSQRKAERRRGGLVEESWVPAAPSPESTNMRIAERLRQEKKRRAWDQERDQFNRAIGVLNHSSLHFPARGGEFPMPVLTWHALGVGDGSRGQTATPPMLASGKGAGGGGAAAAAAAAAAHGMQARHEPHLRRMRCVLHPRGEPGLRRSLSVTYESRPSSPDSANYGKGLLATTCEVPQPLQLDRGLSSAHVCSRILSHLNRHHRKDQPGVALEKAVFLVRDEATGIEIEVDKHSHEPFFF